MNDAAGETDAGDEGDDPAVSQPLRLNSLEMSSMIIESGTRLPACMAASALRPVVSSQELVLVN